MLIKTLLNKCYPVKNFVYGNVGNVGLVNFKNNYSTKGETNVQTPDRFAGLSYLYF